MRRKKLTTKTTSRSTRSGFVMSGMAFLLVIAALAGGCGGEEEQSGGSPEEEVAEQSVAEQETGSEETESTQTTEEESAEDSDATIGETVAVGNVQWRVTDAEQSDELISIKGEYEEGSFVIADVTFGNRSNQDITLATPFLTVVDSEGNEFEADIENNFIFLYPEENMFVDPIEPGTAKEGKVIFPVDPDSSDLNLQVGEANFASDETAYIDLGL